MSDRPHLVPPEVCPVTWPLDDPNAEDRDRGHMHRCRRSAGHAGHAEHACGCGATYVELGVVIDMADHDTRPTDNPLIHNLPDVDNASRPMIGHDGPLQVCQLCGAVIPREWRNVHLHWHNLLGTTLDMLGLLADPDNWEPAP